MSRELIYLTDICDFVSDKISAIEIDKETYISTENMLSDLGGVTTPSNVPSAGKVNSYQSGDVLFSNIRTYFRKVWLADKTGGCSNDLIVFRPKENISSEYLFLVLSDPAFIEFTVKTSKGTKMPRGDKKAIQQYQIPKLSTEERDCIGSILHDFSNKIALNRQMNQTLENMAQALFKSWFVDFDPVLDNALLTGNEIPEALQTKMEKRLKIKESQGLKQDSRFPDRFVYEEDLGKFIPEGWEVKKLGDIVDHKKGFAFKSTWYQDKGHKVVRVSDTTEDSIDINSCNSISSEKALEYLTYQLDENDLIIATVGSWPPNYSSVVGKVIRVPRTAKGALLNQNAVRLKLKSGLNFHQGLLYYNLKNDYFMNYIVNRAQGSANQASITLKSIFKFPVVFGEKKVLSSFSDLINNTFDKQNNQFTQSETLTQLRDTLLPKLISGKLKVPEAMLAVEKAIT